MSQSDIGFVHRFVPSAKPDSPLLLLLHGTGGTEEDLLPLGQAIAYEAALLSPRGKVLENGMTRYFRRVALNVFDLEDLRLRALELGEFLESAKREYGLTDRKTISVGYSNGANVAVALLTLRPELLNGVILFRANAPALPDPIPDLHGKFAMISAGRFDEYVEPQNSEVLAEKLKAAGANVSLLWNEVGHGLVQDEIVAAKEWLKSSFTKSG